MENEIGTERIHELKTWSEYYSLVEDRVKNFEVRLNDRDYQVGDVLVLKEFSAGTQRFTGRSVRRSITYVLSHPDFVKEGHVILSIK
jgi:hypothetical protein